MNTDQRDIVIRPATEGDYRSIVGLWQASGLDTRPAGRDSAEAFRKQLRHFPTTYLLAEHDGRLIGVVLGTHDARKGWINRLAVHPDYRHCGLARRLIQACEQAFLDQGIEIFAALVETENVTSTRVFERVGYRRDIPVHYFHRRLRQDV